MTRLLKLVGGQGYIFVRPKDIAYIAHTQEGDTHVYFRDGMPPLQIFNHNADEIAAFIRDHGRPAPEDEPTPTHPPEVWYVQHKEHVNRGTSYFGYLTEERAEQFRRGLPPETRDQYEVRRLRVNPS